MAIPHVAVHPGLLHQGLRALLVQHLGQRVVGLPAGHLRGKAAGHRPQQVTCAAALCCSCQPRQRGLLPGLIEGSGCGRAGDPTRRPRATHSHPGRSLELSDARNQTCRRGGPGAPRLHSICGAQTGLGWADQSPSVAGLAPQAQHTLAVPRSPQLHPMAARQGSEALLPPGKPSRAGSGAPSACGACREQAHLFECLECLRAASGQVRARQAPGQRAAPNCHAVRRLGAAEQARPAAQGKDSVWCSAKCFQEHWHSTHGPSRRCGAPPPAACLPAYAGGGAAQG